MALLAHEVVHVPQELGSGPSLFLTNYIGAYLFGLARGLSPDGAYREIPYEKQAFAIGKYIQGDLARRFGNSRICLCDQP